MPSFTLGNAAPLVPVTDLAASLDDYQNALGFSLDWRGTWTMASVSRDGCTLFLSQRDQGNPGIWIWVGLQGDQGVEALLEELLERGALLRQGPTNFAWALEIQVEDLDGNVIRFGSDPKPDVPFGPWKDMHGRYWVETPGGGYDQVAPPPQ
jgi:catechol 2,3-dioxygenase-like lactoylglutathione lyase family enzyme